jgi:2-dehydro-3-deoxyphosphogluconate aldolase / (4S)-4-hydroxy-2-oxoglutarate aldolase
MEISKQDIVQSAGGKQHKPAFWLLGILRGVLSSEISPLVDCVRTSGLPAIEITMNTPGACQLIAQMKRESKGDFLVGAGTVLTQEEAKQALAAGADFLVSPVLVLEVCSVCLQAGVDYFPGAFTPQEIWNAYLAGAKMVKVFPIKFLGPQYIQEVRGPLSQVPMLACGGISAQTLPQYIQAGATGAAFGGSVFSRARLEQGQWDVITQELSALVTATGNGTFSENPS